MQMPGAGEEAHSANGRRVVRLEGQALASPYTCICLSETRRRLVDLRRSGAMTHGGSTNKMRSPTRTDCSRPVAILAR